MVEMQTRNGKILPIKGHVDMVSKDGLGENAQDLYKLKPDKIPEWRGEVVTKSYTYLRNFW